MPIPFAPQQKGIPFLKDNQEDTVDSVLGFTNSQRHGWCFRTILTICIHQQTPCTASSILAALLYQCTMFIPFALYQKAIPFLKDNQEHCRFSVRGFTDSQQTQVVSGSVLDSLCLYDTSSSKITPNVVYGYMQLL